MAEPRPVRQGVQATDFTRTPSTASRYAARSTITQTAADGKYHPQPVSQTAAHASVLVPLPSAEPSWEREHSYRGCGDDGDPALELGDLGTPADLDPPLLQAVLDRTQRTHFDELYEDAAQVPRAPLSETISSILHEFGDPRSSVDSWRRLGWMTRAILMAVLPTLKGHADQAERSGQGKALQPFADRAASVLTSLGSWLDSCADGDSGPTLAPATLAPQAANDAFSVAVNAASIRAERANALNSVKEILDDVFEGYAIIPGSRDRRALFDWWLEEVVPAAWAQRLPRRIWTVQGPIDLPGTSVC